MFCHRCGKELKDGNLVCPYCMARLQDIKTIQFAKNTTITPEQTKTSFVTGALLFGLIITYVGPLLIWILIFIIAALFM